MANTPTLDRRARYERKRRQLNISVTPAEYDELCRRAGEHGFVSPRRGADGRRLSQPAPSKLAQEVIRAWLRDGEVVSRPTESRPEVPDLIREVRRIGTNVNQMVRLAQAMKSRRDIFDRQVGCAREVESVWGEVRQLLAALERRAKGEP